MSSRKTMDGVENVYAAAQKWVDCALRKDDSLFTPGKPIWTRELLGELRECYLDNPDTSNRNFYVKLQDQLAGKSAEVYQLMGEVLYAHYLIIWREGMKGSTKEERINQVFQWSKRQLAIPDDLVAGLTPGIARIGTAYSGFLPFMVGYLIEFVDQWKEREPDERRTIIDHPWAFKDFAVQLGHRSELFGESSARYYPQQEALLHLVHPDTFEGIVSFEHKEKIAGAKSFAHFVTEEIPDVDRKLVKIRQGLEVGLDRDFDFYELNIRSWWDTETSAPWWDPSTSNPWAKYLRIASEFLHSGRMWPWELDYKYETGQKLREAIETVRSGTSDDWAVQVKRGLAGNLIFPIQQAKLGKIP